jgi:hypothetical protein
MEAWKLNRGTAISFLALLLMALEGCAPRMAVPPTAPAPPPAAGKVRGMAVPTGVSVPIEGATVSVGTRRGTVAADNSFSLGEVEPGKQHVGVEKLFPSGGVRRVLGISTIFVADNPVDIKVAVRDATDVDAFCLSCHPPLGKATRRDQKIRDAHPSGIVAVKAVGDRALLDQRGRVTCESCHTAHGPGEHPFFGRGEIRRGAYCNRCHRSGGSG